jgi:hypothetical protein
MTDLKAIRGNKPKAMAEARILECACGCRTFVEVRTGVAVNDKGKVIHKGTPTLVCTECGKQQP